MRRLGAVELIEAKRDGHEHTADEIGQVVRQYTDGVIPDCQMAAWLMAVLQRGMSAAETIALTGAMVRSGRTTDLSAIPGVKVDKHSTGGVADTTTLVLAPWVAACGVPVPKMSGRGLGFTGGTLDKLESIPGFRTQLSEAQFAMQMERIGVAVIAQSSTLAPADKKIYALRDITATVPSIPLIVASILSKKIAGGADAIVLDVKVGSGAFMKTDAEAHVLAHELVVAGEAFERRIACLMTDMEEPLGRAVGNALEVAEAVRALRNEGDEALTGVCLALGARMLVLGEAASDEREATRLLKEKLASGAALEKFETWVAEQGGDPRIAEDPGRLPQSKCVRDVRCAESGYVVRMDAESIARVAVDLGAGRTDRDARIDPGAGVVLNVRVGDCVASGDVVFRMHASTESLLDRCEELLAHAWGVGSDPPPRRPRVHDLPPDCTGVAS